MLRLRSCGGTWPGWQEFFRTTSIEEDSEKKPTENKPSGNLDKDKGQQHSRTLQEADKLTEKSRSTSPASFVQPLYISKVNTVAQILLVAGCITSTSYGWPSQEVILSLGGITAGLTVASGIAYLREHKSKSGQ